MGSGVSAASTAQSSLRYHKQFLDMERKCENGHFRANLDDYKQALQAAIQHEALDFLEVLLAGGPAKKAFPVHMAADLGKVEALDLMLGAGFPGNIKDSRGLTALHACALSLADPETTALCAALLLLRYPSLWKIYDNRGLAPVHVAVQAGHRDVLHALLQHGAQAEFKTMDGKTAFDMARAYGHTDLLTILSKPDKRGVAITSDRRNERAGSAKPRYIPAPPEEVDMERIMQVWDRFFENAFKLAEQRQAEHDATPQAAQKKKKKKQQLKQASNPYEDYKVTPLNDIKSSGQYNDPPFAWGDETVAEPQRTPDGDGDGAYWECLDWYQHVLCYDGDYDSYYVAHLPSAQKYWLQDYYGFLGTGTLAAHYRFFFDPLEVLSAYSLPTNVLACAELGWMVCYDSGGNHCYWRQLVTDATENYLPLAEDGGGEGFSSPEVLDWLQLGRYEADSRHCSAPQAIAQAWVLVVINDEEDHRRNAKLAWQEPVAATWYYLNLVTRETRWTPPGSSADCPEGSYAWQELLQQWGSWRLCCSEDSPQELFWCDIETGESVWATE